MNRRFELTVERVPGALERVLSVVRRRGLGVEELSVRAADPKAWNVVVVAAAPSSEATLALRQFESLVNVRHAALEEV